MSKRGLGALACLALVAAAAWWGGTVRGGKKAADGWSEVAPGVWRSAGLPAGYALVEGDAALLIDAPRTAEGLPAKKVEMVLLTHHHRDSCAAAGRFLAD